MWLRDSLPHDIPGVRVFTYGYPSELSGSTSFQDLEAISTTFRNNLKAVRRQEIVSSVTNMWLVIKFSINITGQLGKYFAKAFGLCRVQFRWTRIEKGIVFTGSNDRRI